MKWVSGGNLCEYSAKEIALMQFQEQDPQQNPAGDKQNKVMCFGREKFYFNSRFKI